jgi:hypothetical protein
MIFEMEIFSNFFLFFFDLRYQIILAQKFYCLNFLNIFVDFFVFVFSFVCLLFCLCVFDFYVSFKYLRHWKALSESDWPERRSRFCFLANFSYYPYNRRTKRDLK